MSRVLSKGSKSLKYPTSFFIFWYFLAACLTASKSVLCSRTECKNWFSSGGFSSFGRKDCKNETRRL